MFSGVAGASYILIVVVATWVYLFIKTHWLFQFTLLYVNHSTATERRKEAARVFGAHCGKAGKERREAGDGDLVEWLCHGADPEARLGPGRPQGGACAAGRRGVPREAWKGQPGGAGPADSPHPALPVLPESVLERPAPGAQSSPRSLPAVPSTVTPRRCRRELGRGPEAPLVVTRGVCAGGLLLSLSGSEPWMLDKVSPQNREAPSHWTST